jgi:hypothetical protein
MVKDRDLAMYVAVYDNVALAEADLGAIDQLHKLDLVGMFDAAIVEKRNDKPHIVRRMDRAMVRVIPDVLNFGPLPRNELKKAAAELDAGQASLIVVGEPTLEKAFDKAVTHASKTVKQVFDATADELAREMKEAAGS